MMKRKRLSFEVLEDRKVLANISVTTLADVVADDGLISLREAVEAANQDSMIEGIQALGHDTIQFSPDLFIDGPQTLILEQITTGVFSSNYAILVDSTVTIEGPGSDLLTIQANNDSDVFYSAIRSEYADLSIKDVSLSTNVEPTGFINGPTAVYAEGGEVHIEDVVLSDWFYGLIADSTNNVTVLTSSFLDNHNGLAVSQRSNLLVDGSHLSGNEIGYASFVPKGAFESRALEESTSSFVLMEHRLVDTMFENNQIGVKVEGGVYTVFERTTFEGNTSGGIQTARGPNTIHVIDSAFTNNSAMDPAILGGGAIYTYGSSDNPALVVEGSLFENNRSARGGAIFVRDGFAQIHDSVFRANQADSSGGAISSWSLSPEERYGIDITNSFFEGNSALLDGGALFSVARTNIDSSTFSDNESHKGGALALYQTGWDSPTIIQNSTFSGNRAIDFIHDDESLPEGGAILFSKSSRDEFGLNIIQSTVVNNLTENSNSAAVFVRRELDASDPASELVVVGSVISDNSSIGTDGGVVPLSLHYDLYLYCDKGSFENRALLSQAEFQDSDFWNNSSFEYSMIGNTISTITFSHPNCNDGQKFLAGPPLPESTVESPDANGNIIAGPVNGEIDPRLAPLDYYGGVTPTRAPYSDSPIINAGTLAPVEFVDVGVLQGDQRGVPYLRKYGARVDMGAVEWHPNSYLPGDYNNDSVVNAADFTVWRDQLSNEGTSPTADGNGDGVIDELDYNTWRFAYGKSGHDLGVNVPFPPATETLVMESPVIEQNSFFSSSLSTSAGESNDLVHQEAVEDSRARQLALLLVDYSHLISDDLGIDVADSKERKDVDEALASDKEEWLLSII